MIKNPWGDYDEPWDDNDEYDEWLQILRKGVIEDEFGYEPGEFSVYPDAWWPLFKEGLTPRAAWQRALDAHKHARKKGTNR